MTRQELLNRFINNPNSMNKSNRKLGERYGFTPEQVRQIKEEARKITSEQDLVRTNSHSGKGTSPSTSPGQKTGTTSFAEDLEKGTAEFTGLFDSEIKNLDDLIEKCKIDTTIWNIDKYIQNYWGNNNYPCWQVKAFLSKKQGLESEIISDLLSNYKSNYVPLSPADIYAGNPTFEGSATLLISIADFHLDKRTLDGKTVEEKISLYRQILRNLVFKAHLSHNIHEICYLISNDFFHTDTIFDTTTKGTPQQSSVSWNNAYEAGFDLQVESINFLRQFCKKLNVFHIPSNHSRTKEYYLAHALSVYFKPDENIVFDRSSEPTKCYTFGQNFIGFHHGDVRDYNQLPTYFASKFKKEWGQCQFAEIALADKHHRKEWKHSLTKNEIHGTRMFIAPSLSSEDEWHKNSLYDLAIRASIARVYDYDRGYVTEFEERV